MLPVLYFALMGQVAAEPQITMGELRKFVPAGLRPEKVKLNPGWSLALKASAAKPSPATISGVMAEGAKLAAKDLARRPFIEAHKNRNERPDNVHDLVTAWRKGTGTDLARRSKRVLTRYESRMATMRSALRYPVWSQPMYPDKLIPKVGDMPNVLFPELSGMKDLTYAFVLKAYVDLAEKRTAAADKDLDDAWSIGDHAMGGSIIGYLVGTAETAIVSANVLQMAKRNQLSQTTIKRFVGRLASTDVRGRLATTLKWEFDSFAVWSIASMPDPSKEVVKADADDGSALLRGHPRPFDRAQTVRWCADIYLEAIANLSRPWSGQVDIERKYKGIYEVLPAAFRSSNETDEEKPKPSDAELSAAKVILLTITNPIGRSLLEPTSSVGMKIAESGFLVESRYRSHAVALAILARKKRTGAWPTSQNELTKQDGLSTVPNDPYSGKPYRYDPNKLTLSGAGPDKSYGVKYAVNLKAKV